MCECLSYEDGAEYLCEACGPRWREYEASIQRRPVTAPAPLDAAIQALDRWDSLPVTHRYDYEAANVIAAFRSLLAALSVYFSTDSAAEPLNVLELHTTMNDLMPRGDAGGEGR